MMFSSYCNFTSGSSNLAAAYPFNINRLTILQIAAVLYLRHLPLRGV